MLSFPQQAVLSQQYSSKIPTELEYVERPVFMTEVNFQKFWNFELASQECIKVPNWLNIGLMQRDRQHSQNLNNDTFYRPPVNSA